MHIANTNFFLTPLGFLIIYAKKKKKVAQQSIKVSWRGPVQNGPIISNEWMTRQLLRVLVLTHLPLEGDAHGQSRPPHVLSCCEDQETNFDLPTAYFLLSTWIRPSSSCKHANMTLDSLIVSLLKTDNWFTILVLLPGCDFLCLRDCWKGMLVKSH